MARQLFKKLAQKYPLLRFLWSLEQLLTHIHELGDFLRRQIYLLIRNQDLFFWYWQFHRQSLAPIRLSHIQLSEKMDRRLKLPVVDIIIPWYGDANIFTLLEILQQTHSGLVHEVLIIDDASPNNRLAQKLRHYAEAKHAVPLRYLRNPSNLGFVGTANLGISRTNLDVVILNSDTQPQGDWLRAMVEVLASDDLSATVTPLSNNATIFSVPEMNVANEDFLPEGTAEFLRRVAPVDSLPVPTGHGFCLLVRRKYIRAYGCFDEASFGRGYGEENDLCQRFEAQGLKNLLAAKGYVLHLEGRSFSAADRLQLLQENYHRVVKRYPHYGRTVSEFIARNPLSDVQTLLTRFRADEQLLSVPAVLVVVHQNPFTVIGGVERETVLMLRHLKRKYPHYLILIYFYDQKSETRQLGLIRDGDLVRIISFGAKVSPEQSLRWILQAFSVKLGIVEHLINHSLNYGSLLRRANVPAILYVHDYYYFSQIPDLINSSGSFCHWTMEMRNCAACQKNDFTIPPKTWRKLGRKLLVEDFNQVIFNSEFCLMQYNRWLRLPELPKFVVSYPELGAKP